MNFSEILGTLSSIAVAVERVTEILKPVYLNIKNAILKKESAECTILEKRSISIIIGIAICIFAQVGLDIPGVNEPAAVQSILAGFVASLGSNVLHTMLTILTGIKDGTEARAARTRAQARE